MDAMSKLKTTMSIQEVNE